MINKFFECLLPTTICNLECEYCYIIQEDRRGMKNIDLDYTVEHILKCLRKERLGGECFFSLCGTGETFLQKELIPLVDGLLEEGHYVNITTNGTITNKIKELIEVIGPKSNRLVFSFSLHYLDLKKRNLINAFFDNVNYVKKNGCSFLIQMNLYDGYLPCIEEIKRLCKEKTGAYPQVAATRLETKGNVENNIKLHTALSDAEYLAIGNGFNSPLFEFTMKNFNVKRKEFCYAGEWSFNLNMKNGVLKDCYHSGKIQDIFSDPNAPIKCCAVGNNCCSRYCINSSHFMSLGVIPSLKTPSYTELRNRVEAGWYNKAMLDVLNTQFKDVNKQYSLLQKIYSNLIHKPRYLKRKIKIFLRGNK